MKTSNHNTRREFLSASLKSAVILSAGTSLFGTVMSPIAALAQNSDAALQAKVAELGTASLQTSQLALSKAAHAEVKLFAKFEAAEQETMGKILKDMGTKVPALSPEGTALLAKLQALSGAAFDKAFMQGQVETHQKLKATVSALMSASQDKHVKHVTALALATINEHTERGGMILAKLG